MKLLSDGNQKHAHQLSTFLRRVHFILKLNTRLKGELTYLENSINDLMSYGRGNIHDSEAINSTIDFLIAHHRWSAMSSIVEATLAFLHGTVSVTASLSVLLSRALLLSILHDRSCDFLQACLTDFAADIVLVLNANTSHTAKHLLEGAKKSIFVKAVLYVSKHGASDDHRGFGKWAISSPKLLSTLLDAIETQAAEFGAQPQVLIHHFLLNKCLVHNSTSASSTTQHHLLDGNLPNESITSRSKNPPRISRYGPQNG